MRIDTFSPYIDCLFAIDVLTIDIFGILEFYTFVSMISSYCLIFTCFINVVSIIDWRNVQCCFLFGILLNSQNLVSLYGYKEFTWYFCVVLFCFIAIMTNFELQIINMQVSNVSYPKMKSIFEVKNQKILIWTFNSAPLFSHYFYYQQYLECVNTAFNY